MGKTYTGRFIAVNSSFVIQIGSCRRRPRWSKTPFHVANKFRPKSHPWSSNHDEILKLIPLPQNTFAVVVMSYGQYFMLLYLCPHPRNQLAANSLNLSMCLKAQKESGSQTSVPCLKCARAESTSCRALGRVRGSIWRRKGTTSCRSRE